jgi:hypothetical protein
MSTQTQEEKNQAFAKKAEQILLDFDKDVEQMKAKLMGEFSELARGKREAAEAADSAKNNPDAALEGLDEA